MHAGWFRSLQAWHLAPCTAADLVAAKIHPCGLGYLGTLVPPLAAKHPAHSGTAPQCLPWQAGFLEYYLGRVDWLGAAPRLFASRLPANPPASLARTFQHLSSPASCTQLPPRAWPNPTLSVQPPLARKVRLVATDSHPSPQDGGSKDEQESDAPCQKEGAEEGTARGQYPEGAPAPQLPRF